MVTQWLCPVVLAELIDKKLRDCGDKGVPGVRPLESDEEALYGPHIREPGSWYPIDNDTAVLRTGIRRIGGPNLAVHVQQILLADELKRESSAGLVQLNGRCPNCPNVRRNS